MWRRADVGNLLEDFRDLMDKCRGAGDVRTIGKSVESVFQEL